MSISRVYPEGQTAETTGGNVSQNSRDTESGADHAKERVLRKLSFALFLRTIHLAWHIPPWCLL